MDEEIIVALVTLVGVIFSAAVGVKTSRHASAINDAVNHRHASEPRLLDHVRTMAAEVAEIKAWRERWESLPAELSTDGGLVARFERIDAKIDIAAGAAHRIHRDLQAHVEWEIDKYRTLEALIHSYHPEEAKR